LTRPAGELLLDAGQRDHSGNGAGEHLGLFMGDEALRGHRAPIFAS
jgi:hypothetical protein